MLPRKVRRDSSDRRSSCARNSGVKKLVRVAVGTGLALVEGLEVVLDLRVEVAGHRLAGDRVLHHLAVLADDAQVLQTRAHLSALAGEVGVVALLAPAPRLALDADVVGARAQPAGGLALRGSAAALAGQQALALDEVLVLGAAAVAASPIAPAAAAVRLAPALEVLARARRLVLRAHLVERALHGFHRAVGLPALHRLHALGGVALPVGAALATEPLHLFQELLELLRRDLF